MKTVLDLIREFSSLNDEKAANGGTLPPAFEERWGELKSFYNLVLAENGYVIRPVTRRNGRPGSQRLLSRGDLRVPAEMELFFQFKGEYYTGTLLNVSRGGAFLAAKELFPLGSRLVLHLSNISGGMEPLLEATGEAVWVTATGIPELDLPRGMGLQFLDYEKVEQKLATFVLETLEKRFSRVDPSAVDPEFARREELAL